MRYLSDATRHLLEVASVLCGMASLTCRHEETMIPNEVSATARMAARANLLLGSTNCMEGIKRCCTSPRSSATKC